MNRTLVGLSAALVCGIAIGAVGIRTLPAQEKREVYVSPGADKKTLVNEPLHGTEAQMVTLDQYVMPPGWVGGKHYHTGPVYVYVLEGSFTMDEQGKDRHTFQAGEVYREPIGTPMQARNLNAQEPLKLLVFQITPKGEPLMVKAE
jgi:quercetin dioxygenase-like cupin family protein